MQEQDARVRKELKSHWLAQSLAATLPSQADKQLEVSAVMSRKVERAVAAMPCEAAETPAAPRHSW